MCPRKTAHHQSCTTIRGVRHLEKLRVDFATDESATMLLGCNSYGPRSTKWVKDEVPWFGVHEHQFFHQWQWFGVWVLRLGNKSLGEHPRHRAPVNWIEDWRLALEY